MLSILTPILFKGFVNWVHPWRVVVGEPIFLYGEDFDSPYCPVNFEVTNEHC
jgi:hypothetical protein